MVGNFWIVVLNLVVWDDQIKILQKKFAEPDIYPSQLGNLALSWSPYNLLNYFRSNQGISRGSIFLQQYKDTK
jgi:hypothetical protein